jgi:multidrug efflux pump subunit AcrB/ABC-type multidrug transport system ATPase subunit
MDFIIKRKILISMLFVAVTMLGVFSYRQLSVELYPSIQIPYLFVQVGTSLDVDPKYMESQAIIPLEGAIGTLKDVNKIVSSAGSQQGSIQISYAPGTNIKFAYLKLQEKIDEAKKNIPQDFYVQAVKFDMEQLNNALMTIQVKGGGGVDRVRQIVNRELESKFKNIEGIANVGIFGGREKSLEIILKDEVCKAFGITPSDVRSALSRNSGARTFAGKLLQNNQYVFVNVSSDYSNLNEVNELVVRQNGSVKLKDIADIHFGVKEQDTYSRVDGKEAVTLQLTRDTESNMIDLANRVKAEIKKLNGEFKSKDIEIVVQNNSAETMEKNIDLIIKLALIGGLLAIFILWIFLKNVRLVVAVGVAIPISVYTAFNFFYAYGVTLNSLTLLGMALAIGMLLDNSVVVMENIYRLASKNGDIDTAVKQGTKEVWRSITASTLTTVAVFLPFAFSDNFMIGVFGKHIGVSIISTMLISLVVALLLVPMITHTLLKAQIKSDRLNFERISFHNRLIQIYMVLLKSCMRFPARTVMSALGIFFLTLLISLGISLVKMEEPELVDLTLYVNMPGGTTLDNTDKMVAEVEKRLAKLPEKKELVSQIYEEEAVLTISLVKDFKKIRNFGVPNIKKEIMNTLNGMDPAGFSWDPPMSSRRFGGSSGGGGGGGDDLDLGQMMGIGTQSEKIIIKGQNYNAILNQASLLNYYLSQQSSVSSSYVSVPSVRPEILLNLDKQLMAAYDIPASSVLSELSSFPRQFSSGAKFKQGTDEYDIQIITQTNKEEQSRDLNELKRLPVKGANASLLELQNISKFVFNEGASVIKRTNQEKQLEIVYTFIGEVNDDNELLTAARLEVDNLVRNANIPSDVSIEVIHENQDLGDFKFLILAAIILVFMILAAVFESFSKPVVMMFAIPLAAIGSFIALILTGNSILNANTITGFIILVGIVVNNGIILIDYSNVLKASGYRPSRALMMAGLARVRPILITAVTTIIALFPLAMGKAEYVTQIGTPFAVTVIGGLGLSTLLTLVFIPSMNAGMSSALKWIFSQKAITKLIILAVYVFGGLFIYKEIESLVWKIIDYILLVVLTPASVYFVQTSLRKANEKLIGESTPIKITVRNLVKIYDRDTRFVREWKSGLKIRQRVGLEKEYRTWRDFDYLVWHLPLIGYMVYFIYFYLESGTWFLFLPVGLYLMVLGTLNPAVRYAHGLKAQQKKKWIVRSILTLNKLFFWLFPAFAMAAFKARFGLLGLIIPLLVVWYLVLAIKVTSDKLYKEKVNITRLTGRFKGLRKLFYRFVLVIPVIGKKKTPFKALKGVSLEIENGMFGLLGPNGAGKSTLMRIICGILEPSYGQITINEFDIKEKREELQGLIGYLPQEFGMYENLTAWEFLNYMGILKKIYDRQAREARVQYVLEAVHMLDHKDEKIGSFSGGMKQRIGIAQILLHLPRILVVDEPTAGLDPRERIRFRNLLVELSRERVVIFSTHIIEDVASSCNKVAVVKGGLVKYLGEPIQMAQLAEGKIWGIDMSIEAFDLFKEDHIIIHHMRDGDNIRVRCLSETSPDENARPVKANLEDAYLWLLSN